MIQVQIVFHRKSITLENLMNCIYTYKLISIIRVLKFLFKERTR